MSAIPCQRLTPEELLQFDLFRDDDHAALQWLSERFEVVCYEEGDTVIEEGDVADRFAVVLAGQLSFSAPADPSLGVFFISQGEPTGVLPFSRMKTFRGRACTTQPTRLAVMDVSHLPELVYRAPRLAEKLVWEMTDRAREFTQLAERNSKMLALGKLSAGLAHELNNPASAVVRSATKLREILLIRRDEAVQIRAQFFPEMVQKTLQELSDISLSAAQHQIVMDDLEKSDRESDLADWLELHGLDPAKAPDLVSAGITVDVLEPITKVYDGKMLDKILTLLLSDFQMLALIAEIEEASRRMSQLVQDIKSYSYMDTSSANEIDIAEGIRATLRMFQHQLKHGFTLNKNFAANMPKIHANGNELNQVWTNLIDNAIDAMENVEPDRKVLDVRTREERDAIVVEIGDHGQGIPEDVQGRIFEPFFTTKGVGKGTGLGLDIVQRIVRNHKGSVKLDSKPGHTVFQIRLPKK